MNFTNEAVDEGYCLGICVFVREGQGWREGCKLTVGEDSVFL
jgi:hypothetical protein